MKTISNLVNEVGGIIDNLSLSTHEKKFQDFLPFFF